MDENEQWIFDDKRELLTFRYNNRMFLKSHYLLEVYTEIVYG